MEMVQLKMRLDQVTGRCQILKEVLLPDRDQPEYDPDKTYQLYSLGYGSAKGFIEYTEEEVVAEFRKEWGHEPEFLLKHGGGWTVGPVPEKKGRKNG